MASKTADETAAEARGEGRTAETDEAARKGAEGIQDVEQQQEKDQRMNRPDGPDEPSDQGAEEPRDRAGEPDEAAADDTADKGGEPTGASRADDAAGPKSVPAQDAQGPDASDAGGGTGAADSGADGAAGAAGAPEDAGAAGESGGHYAGATGATVPLAEDTAARTTSGIGQGAGAVVAAGLGVVSLTGSWLGTVAGARESLIGQLETTQGASVAKQVQEVYGDQWHVTALVGGLFALLALIVGVVVLARPAFGPPGESQTPWIKSVAWGGVVLGVIGLLLAVLKYSDAILGLPTVAS